MSSKKLSGAENRKRKLAREHDISKSSKCLASFLKPTSDVMVGQDQDESDYTLGEETIPETSDTYDATTSSLNPCPPTNVSENLQPSTSFELEQNIKFESYVLNDPATWPSPLTSTFRDSILSSNLLNEARVENSTYPQDSDNRCFSVKLYYRVTSNGEKYFRK